MPSSESTDWDKINPVKITTIKEEIAKNFTNLLAALASKNDYVNQ